MKETETKAVTKKQYHKFQNPAQAHKTSKNYQKKQLKNKLQLDEVNAVKSTDIYWK